MFDWFPKKEAFIADNKLSAHIIIFSQCDSIKRRCDFERLANKLRERCGFVRQKISKQTEILKLLANNNTISCVCSAEKFHFHAPIRALF